MDKRTYDIWNDDDGAEEETAKKPRRLRRFLIFLLVLVIVLGIVALAAWRGTAMTNLHPIGLPCWRTRWWFSRTRHCGWLVRMGKTSGLFPSA